MPVMPVMLVVLVMLVMLDMLVVRDAVNSGARCTVAVAPPLITCTMARDFNRFTESRLIPSRHAAYFSNAFCFLRCLYGLCFCVITRRRPKPTR